jgi:cytochrome c oxidase assembly factor CtaG
LYDTVFELQQSGYSEWWFPAVGLALALVFGAVLYYYERLARQRPSKARRVFAWATPFFLVLWTVSAVRATYGEQHKLLATRP